MPDSGIDVEQACDRIADLVERLLEAHPSVPGVAVALRGRSGETAAVVRGLAHPASGAPLTIDHAHRLASCTKPFVAAAVMSLVVDGLVDLDALVIDGVSSEVAALLAGYEHGRAITVRQVLQHRSGLVDHSTFPEFGEAITTAWTPQRQLSPDGLVRAHQLSEGQDTHGWSPTFDLFGGGGLVSTLPDLCRWWSDWFGDAGASDLHTAGAAPALGPDGTPFPGGDRVGLGVFGREVGGRVVWAHGGFWGLETGHVRDLGVSYALSITHRAAGIPAPHTVGNAVVAALEPGA